MDCQCCFKISKQNILFSLEQNGLFSQRKQPVDFLEVTAVVNMETLCCILLAAELRLQSEPSLNKQTANLIVFLIYGQCAFEINCALTLRDPVAGGTRYQNKNSARSSNGEVVLDCRWLCCSRRTRHVNHHVDAFRPDSDFTAFLYVTGDPILSHLERQSETSALHLQPGERRPGRVHAHL